MKQYPHTSPRSSLIGLAAAVATAATIAVAVVLPTAVHVQPDAAPAAQTAPPQVVMLDRIEVVATRPASVHKAASDAISKARG